MENVTSDVRQCEACGKYLVLSRHEACNAATKPVETEKGAQCRDCFHTKPEEWDSYPQFLKKSGFVKCYRVTPAESVPNVGHHCHRWLSERFDPNGKDPVDIPEERKLVQEPAPLSLVTKEDEHRTKMSEAAKKRVPKYNFTDEMLLRAKELRTQETPVSMWEVLRIIIKEFSPEFKQSDTVAASFRLKLHERYPELKGIKAEPKRLRGGISTPEQLRARPDAVKAVDNKLSKITTTQDLVKGVHNEKGETEVEARTPAEPIVETESEKKVALQFEDLDWKNTKKAGIQGETAIECPKSCVIRFGFFGDKICKYECFIKSATADGLNIEIPSLGKLTLNWSAIDHIHTKGGTG